MGDLNSEKSLQIGFCGNEFASIKTSDLAHLAGDVGFEALSFSSAQVNEMK